MPIIKLHQQPLHPEGEFCGQARKVSQGWSKPKPRPDGTTPEPHMIFTVPLHSHIGKTITHTLRVLETTGWQWQAACKSGEMIPLAEEFKISCDDLEGRVFYYAVIHEEYLGTPRAKVKLHSKSYACQVNPELEKVTFPNAAPRPIYLQAVNPAGSDPGTQPSQEPSSKTPPPKSDATASAPAPAPVPAPATTPPPSTVSPINDTQEQPVMNQAALEGISEAEFLEALAYAKRLAEEKKNPKGKAA